MYQNCISLRKASISDLAILQKWDEEPHVIESDLNDDWQWEQELIRDVDWRDQFIAELEGRPIGFIQIIDPAKEESRYWGEVPDHLRAIDIWIGDLNHLGKGYGTEMMRLAIEHCFASLDVKAILIDPLESNERAHRFYERLGFQFLEKRQFGEDRCFVYQLNRDNWELTKN